MKASVQRPDGTSLPLTIHKRGEYGYHVSDHVRWVLTYPAGYTALEGDELITDLEPRSYVIATPLEAVLKLGR